MKYHTSDLCVLVLQLRLHITPTTIHETYDNNTFVCLLIVFGLKYRHYHASQSFITVVRWKAIYLQFKHVNVTRLDAVNLRCWWLQETILLQLVDPTILVRDKIENLVIFEGVQCFIRYANQTTGSRSIHFSIKTYCFWKYI